MYDDSRFGGHGATFRPGSPGALAVDMLLLAFADLFLCGPASSVAATVDAVRNAIGLAPCVPAGATMGPEGATAAGNAYCYDCFFEDYNQ